MKLVTEEKKVNAEFHRAHHIINLKKEKAKLEVQQAGMHMLDYIILTLVIVEQLWKGARSGRKVKYILELVYTSRDYRLCLRRLQNSGDTRATVGRNIVTHAAFLAGNLRSRLHPLNMVARAVPLL